MTDAANALQIVGGKAVTDTGHVAPGKNLRALLEGLTEVVPANLQVTDISLDSRNIAAGGAFLALPGLHSHGIGFARQAIDSGARAVLWEPVDGIAAPAVADRAALIAVPHLSALVGAIADRFFDAPSAAVRVAGVTGTNGKTTTAYVLATALAALGKAAAYAGTLGFGRIDAIRPGTHTTPDCVTLHRQLAELRQAGMSHLGMEISSHALDQNRIAGVRIDTAVFTNLTHDHLDYHGTVEAYAAAKSRLFAWPDLRHAVINIDDAFGRTLALAHSTAAALTVYGRSASAFSDQQSRAQQPRTGQLRAQLASPSAYAFAAAVAAGPRGLDIDVETHLGSATMHSRFVGDFNVDNLLAVLAVLLGWDIPLAHAVQAIEQCIAPPGRMETFTAADRPLAIVDYAHTPDALEKALAAARRHCVGKLVCVFGCGGDRDAGKRPVMGAIAERLADAVVVTDDNPRTEDGDVIVAQIIAGLSAPERATIQRDRAAAIELAIESAAAGDVVLVAGKGHEDYQIVGQERRYFSDRDTVTAALQSGIRPAHGADT